MLRLAKTLRSGKLQGIMINSNDERPLVEGGLPESVASAWVEVLYSVEAALERKRREHEQTPADAA